MDFGDFIVSATGAFVGFALATLSDALVRRGIEQKDIKAIAKAFDDELHNNLEIANLAKERFDQRTSKFEYRTNVWRMIISSGLLMKLYSKKTTKYNGCIGLYTVIDCANSLERSIELCYYWQNSSSMGTDDFSRLKEKRLSYSNEIIMRINNITKVGKNTND